MWKRDLTLMVFSDHSSTPRKLLLSKKALLLWVLFSLFCFLVTVFVAGKTVLGHFGYGVYPHEEKINQMEQDLLESQNSMEQSLSNAKKLIEEIVEARIRQKETYLKLQEKSTTLNSVIKEQEEIAEFNNKNPYFKSFLDLITDVVFNTTSSLIISILGSIIGTIILMRFLESKIPLDTKAEKIKGQLKKKNTGSK